MQSQTPAPKGLDHELGVAYYKKGDYPNAVRSLQAAQKEEPNDGEVIQLTGLSLYLAGRPANAIPYLEKVQTWYPRANIDAAYVQTKKYSEGRAAFPKMFGVPPDSTASYLFAARMLLRLDFGPIAEEHGLKAVSLDPKLPLAHQLLGELYLKSPKLSRNSSRKWPSILPTRSLSINSRMLIRAFRSSMKPRSFAALHLAGRHFHRSLHARGKSAEEQG